MVDSRVPSKAAKLPKTASAQPQDAALPNNVSADVRHWLTEFIVRHHLCPWAAGADVRIFVSNATNEFEAMDDLKSETIRLLTVEPGSRLPTTLVVCAGVRPWADDFPRFDEFVRFAQRQEEMIDVSLVAFHPQFARWRSLPPGTPGALKVGDAVFTHYWEAYMDEAGEHVFDHTSGPCSYHKSAAPVSGVVESIDENKLGMRTVRIRFHDLKVENLDADEDDEEEDSDDGWADVPLEFVYQDPNAPLLGDNLLHRSPVPIIHILHGEDLNEEAVHAGEEFVDRLQARNAALARRAHRIMPDVLQ